MPYPFTTRRITAGLITTFFALLFSVVPLNAQRSLYEEAMFMTEYDRNRASQKEANQVEIIVQDADSTRLIIDSTAVEFEAGGRYVHNFGTFDNTAIALEGANLGDQISFYVYDTVFQYIISDQDSSSFYIGLFDGSDGKSGCVYVGSMPSFNWYEGKKLFVKGLSTSLDEKYTSIYAYPLMFQLLKFNKLTGEGVGPELMRGYQSNPLFRERFTSFLQLNDWLEYKYDEYNFHEERKLKFLNKYYTNYPYQRIISGDSILDLRQQLSVNISGGSYRQQIITAQEELQSASKDIDRQRKKGGAFSAQKVAVGLSDFIAERAQEELNLTFFNRFKEKLDGESELTKLFPATRDLMFKFEISNYKTFLAHARETFQNDLDNLGLHLPSILELKKYQKLQNDPNVFNLSLIFSIAELAYREQPVENILLASLQRVQNRKDNLALSINQAIADSVFRQTNEVTLEDPLATYRKSVEQYLALVDSLKQQMLVTADSTEHWINEELDQYRSKSSYTEKGYLKYDEAIWNATKTYRELVRTNFLVEGTSVQAIPESQAYLSTKLRGQDYHLYRQTGRTVNPDDYETYYSQLPLSPQENIVQAIDASTRLIKRDFITVFKRARENIQSAFNTSMDFKVDDLKNQSITGEIILEKFDKSADKYTSLLNAMEFERLFWVATTNKGMEDHYVGGLNFLQLAFDQDFMATDPSLNEGYAAVTRNPEGYDELTRSDFDLNLMNEEKIAEVNQRIQAMDDVCEEYYQKFLEQRERLSATYGNEISKVGMGGVPQVVVDSTIQLQLKENIAGFTIAELRLQYNNAHLSDYERIISVRAVESAELKEEIQLFNDEFLIPVDSMLRELEQQKASLQEQLVQLEKEYAAPLITARENADQLAIAFEVATHLLFSFRNYDRSYDTLYYQDTQRIEVTVQLPPDINGLVSTYTKDSLAIFQRIVPGTTEKVDARWISRQEFRGLRKDDLAWKNFVGLLYQRLKTVEGLPEVEVGALAGLAVKFFDIANEMEEQRNNFRRKQAADERSITFKDYYPFIRSTVDLFNTVLQLDFGNKKGQFFKDLTLVPHISNEALSLYENIFVKDYGNAVLNATELMKIIVGQVPEKFKTQFQDSTQLDLTKALRREQTANQRGINAVFRYGSFMASMINAESSDQIKTILRSTTLPPGSSRVKREVLSSFTINSYLGAGLGRDRLLDAPADINANAFGAALSVPIGLTYSFSPAFLRNRSSFSIHIPLLDLGAITAYRSNPSESTANVDNLPELEWKNLFSPGAYLIYNFADSPFSLGLGGQYGPQLREIVPDNGEALFLNSWRFPMAIFTIDVPFYSLHTGPRKVVVRPARRSKQR